MKIGDLKKLIDSVPDDTELVISLDLLTDQGPIDVQFQITNGQAYHASREVHLFGKLSITTNEVQ